MIDFLASIKGNSNYTTRVQQPFQTGDLIQVDLNKEKLLLDKPCLMICQKDDDWNIATYCGDWMVWSALTEKPQDCQNLSVHGFHELFLRAKWLGITHKNLLQERSESSGGA
eukprot:Protomagalhaensia_wolfi_Nauph_80__1364@NODE_1816_length_1322_cov_32_438036_g1418_i0_p1_GENE_NODE_1816_length_1322_cov_32_438036_g1418_i0NODE_1816_length_1322_cov_32_438036_g1418_i0_p1_ORF_typecomplete_len112_score19_12_NODE_1816_length_1322_cov_32_438036_g1418_i0145480